MYEILPQVPGLFIGDIHDSQNAAAQAKQGITVIVNCTSNLAFCAHTRNMYKMRVPVEDNGDVSQFPKMATWLHSIVQFIDKHLQAGDKVLVHCYAGRQRSACVIAAYLMYKHHFSVNEAIVRVNSIKKDAFMPGPNFKSALENYALQLRQS